MVPHGVGSSYQSAPKIKMNAMRDKHPSGAQLMFTVLLSVILFVFVVVTYIVFACVQLDS